MTRNKASLVPVTASPFLSLSPGVGEWASGYVQVVSPLHTAQLIQTQYQGGGEGESGRWCMLWGGRRGGGGRRREEMRGEEGGRRGERREERSEGGL